MAASDPAAAVAALSASLAPLEFALSPLLDRPLDQTLANLAPIQQARLLVMLGYLTHDLSWIYLRTKGISPVDHPVTAELDRIKSFFAKLKPYTDAPSIAQPPDSSAAEKSKTTLDKAAAARFIKHAVGSASSTKRAAAAAPATAPEAGGNGGEQVKLPEIRQVVKGKHQRFADNEESSSSSNEDLEVYDGKRDETKEVPVAPGEPKKKKKKRKAMDPLEGYDDSPRASGASASATPAASGGEGESSKSAKRRAKKARKREAAAAAAAEAATVGGAES